MNWKYYKPKFEYEEIFQDVGWPWSGHKNFAYDLIRNIRPKVVVELGTHKGTSFWSFCQAVKDENLDAKLFAVDTWKGDKHTGFYGEEIFKEVKEIQKKYYGELKIDFLRKAFDEAVSDFENKSIDLLHIDGLHTYEAVKHDFENWISRVKDGGVVMFHDIFVSNNDFGVYKLWEELKKKYKSIEFYHSFGLGILFLDGEKYLDLILAENEMQKRYSFFSEESKNFKINNDLATIQQKDQVIQQKETEIQQKDQEIASKDQAIQQKESEIHQKDAEIAMMRSSKFWKMRKLYLRIKGFRLKDGLKVLGKGYKVYKKKGLQKFFWSLYKYVLYGQGYFRTKPEPEKPKTDYEKWIEENEKLDRNEIEKEIGKFKYKPKISIITPVYNVDSKWLNKCIESVRNQFYENWELCLHDDASTKKETIECLKKWEKKVDKRIKISFGKENQHISGASNEALKMATGEFIALLDNDDELSPDALFENVKLINKHPEADFIYSDEDKFNKKGERIDPFFKPDWSPDLFLSLMYTCHLGVYRKSIVDEIGGFRKGYEGSQDYDLVLRFIEKTSREKIFHIPKVLYHWRKVVGSTADASNAKNYAYISAKKAIQGYLDRNKISGKVLDGSLLGSYRVKREIEKRKKVSIIIPFRDQSAILKKCIESILNKTDYLNYEILLVNNQSEDLETKSYLKTLEQNTRINIIQYNKPFNYSAINNYAVKKSQGDYILFLNNDTEIINKEWLSAMVEHVQRMEVGAVGAKLIYPNQTIQHGGVIMGIGGLAGHAFKHFPLDHPGYFNQLNTIKNYSAVTAACMMVRKKLFMKIGGFNEKDLPIAFNDVDFCLRLAEEGYYNIWTPYAILYHYESISRGSDEDLENKDPIKYARVTAERSYIKSKWSSYILNDPYYNPNLTRDREDFSIKVD